MKKHDRHHFTQVISQVMNDIIGDQSSGYHIPLICDEKDLSPLQNCYPSLIMRKKGRKVGRKERRKGNRHSQIGIHSKEHVISLFLNTVKVIGKKKRITNCQRQEETEET